MLKHNCTFEESQKATTQAQGKAHAQNRPKEAVNLDLRQILGTKTDHGSQTTKMMMKDSKRWGGGKSDFQSYHIISSKCPAFYEKYYKKQENMAHSREKKSQHCP